MVDCDGCSAVDYFIEKRVQFKSDFNYEQQYFYNIPLLGTNIGPWTNGQDTVREEHASMRLTIQDAPDQAPQFSKQEFLLTVEEGTGRNRLTTQTGEGKRFRVKNLSVIGIYFVQTQIWILSGPD